MSSSNGETKIDKCDLSYHEKLDVILEGLADLSEKYDEVIEKLNNFGLDRSAYGIEFLEED